MSLQELLLNFKEHYQQDLKKGFEEAKKQGNIPQDVPFPDDIDVAGRFCFFGFGTQGSDHGCCGNYAGCCAFWFPLCWVHDAMCPNCGNNNPFTWLISTARAFCLKGCVPDAITQQKVKFDTSYVEADSLGGSLLNLSEAVKNRLKNNRRTFEHALFGLKTMDDYRE